MTGTDRIKILNRKIKQNEAQYDLYRKVAKISALPSNNLDKYEYLTREDLGLKPSTVKQAKFEYSPLGKIFNKGLDKEEDKKGLFKRLKNIEGKNKELLNAFTGNNKVRNTFENKVNNQNKSLVYNSQHSFVKFKDDDEFKELSLNSMHKKLKHFHKKFNNLKNVTPRTKDNKELEEKVLDNAGDLCNDLYYIYKEKYIEEINNLNTKDSKNFDYKKLRLTNDYQYESEEEEEKQTSKKEPPEKPTKTDINSLVISKFSKLIAEEEKEINIELFKNYFDFQMPTVMLKTLYILDDRKKNNQLVDRIKSRLSDLKNEIEDMSEEEKEIEKP